ncbi:MAG: molecular chaperone DnaJ, partial [Candidatus Competibacteraceae bacterium]|nr:molecular chaperone DnaJ [Candidatus Competibacteraceae bacterium]
QFRLRGLGLPDLRGYRQGDLIVKVLVEVPTKLSKRQRELLEEFETLSDPKSSPMFKQFFDRLKRAGK